MSDKVVYRSTHPDVLRRWHEVSAAVDAWSTQLKDGLAEIGMAGYKVYYDQVDGNIMGLTPKDGDVPDGWRIDARTGYLKPRLSTKQGKAIGAKLDALRRPDPRDLQGMPKHAFAGLSFLTCGLHYLDDALYVTWSKPIPEGQIDRGIWERVKLSEYHAAVEAHQEATEPPAAFTDALQTAHPAQEGS